ncbi:MAG TPA: hypothetical protein VG406_20080 [Isosphaeraceae bacterium]|jgi:hypothetical protein|nr:hypothetical protein [Isosphaeraceae bacterium]
MPAPGRTTLPTLVTLVIGLAIGWAVATVSTPTLKAGGVDRVDDWAVASGRILNQFTGPNRPALVQDAIYLLNYNGGYLMAAIPAARYSGTGMQVLSDFAERDLMADFQLAPNADAHFLMATGQTMEGWEPLIVFETKTRQVATYRVSTVSPTQPGKPRFDLLERRPIRSQAGR